MTQLERLGYSRWAVQRRVEAAQLRSLAQRDRAVIDAIPVTSVDRTLLDRAEVLSPQRLRSTLEAAERLDLLDVQRLRGLMARSPGRRGLVHDLSLLLGCAAG
jgi:hypothetical protein